MITRRKGMVLLFFMLGCFFTNSFAQESSDKEPKGKAIIRIFTNFHTGFGVDRNDRGFELSRSYLGYQYDLGKGLQIKGVLDVGKSRSVDDLQRIAYVKNALITWKTKKLTLDVGILPTTQYRLQERFWRYRYMAMTFQPYYKFGSSADLGLSATYLLTNWLSADVMIVNGEGYKKIQKNDGLKYGLGTTIQPLKGLSIRLFGSINEGADETKEDISNIATFIGYKGNNFSIAAEYNLMYNYGNVKDANLYGCSVYGTVQMNKNMEIVSRFERLSSKDDWNEGKDESTILAGIQFKLGKYVKLTPNFRMYIPKQSGLENRYMAYISCYFGI